MTTKLQKKNNSSNCQRLQKLEALMGAFVRGDGQILSDDEIRELCRLRALKEKESK